MVTSNIFFLCLMAWHVCTYIAHFSNRRLLPLALLPLFYYIRRGKTQCGLRLNCNGWLNSVSSGKRWSDFNGGLQWDGSHLFPKIMFHCLVLAAIAAHKMWKWTQPAIAPFVLRTAFFIFTALAKMAHSLQKLNIENTLSEFLTWNVSFCYCF